MKRFAQMKLWFDLARFERRFSAVHFSKFYLLFSYCKNLAKQLLCLALVEGGNLRTVKRSSKSPFTSDSTLNRVRGVSGWQYAHSNYYNKQQYIAALNQSHTCKRRHFHSPHLLTAVDASLIRNGALSSARRFMSRTRPQRIMSASFHSPLVDNAAQFNDLQRTNRPLHAFKYYQTGQ
jgi:hypothetical protein